MKRGSHGSWLLALAVAAAWATAGDDALAHGGVDEERSSAEKSPSVEHPNAVSGTQEPVEKDEGEGEGRFAVRLDLVLGWGKVPFAVQNLPTTGSQGITYSRSDDTPSDVQSFVLGGQFEATEHLGAGVRIPFMLGTFSPAGSAARSTTSLGNVEVEGELATSLGEHLKLVGALGVAVPTAQGEEIPSTLVDVPASSVNAGAYDRFSLARAAAFARGYEANALFEPGRMGLVPQLSLVYQGTRFGFEPYVKVENLIRTESSLEAPYVGEMVAAVRAAYRIHPLVEVAVRGWVNVGFAGTPDDKETTVAVEPDLIVSAKPIKGYAGVVVPLAGAPEEARFFGVRLGLSAAF
jgi:hypothetical protein